MIKTLKLGKVEIGEGHPPYIIAEVGSNHNGDMDLCRRLIDAAADAGAHAVKFQSWTDTSLIAEEEYDRNTEYADKKRHFGSLREMVKAYQLTADQHREANSHCKNCGVAFCSTPFSKEEADLLESLGVPFYKIASMDVGYLELLSHVARKGKPVIVSTGMATMGEIERAVGTIRDAGNEQIILLHCVSIYPPDYPTIHLNNMENLRRSFDVPVGFSDHTLGTAIPLAAIALGASIIEKHFTLDQDMPGWDHAISANPTELRTIVSEGQNVFAALGGYRRIVAPAELEKRKKFRRSLVALRAFPAGHRLQPEDLAAKRPGTGISPDEVQYVAGRRLVVSIPRDHVLRWNDLQ
jgi:N-acetylneuraminate synthase